MKKKNNIGKKRKVLKIISIIIPFNMILLPLSSIWMASYVMTGQRQTLEEAMKWQSDHYDTSFYKKMEKTEYLVSGYDGCELHVELLKNPVESDKYIILSHGYTDNRMGSLKYAHMYLDLGYNCIIYDLRGHGENKKTFTTYGILEGKDLSLLVKDTKKRYPNLSKLGLHGESLGAASTITSLKYHPEVDFVVADCGFSDIENVLRGGYKNVHLPSVLVDLTDIGIRIRYHYSLKKMRPIDSLNENKIPILFIHGEKDTFILPKNSKDMSKRTQGYQEYHLIKGAGHAESILTDPQTYQKYVSEFLQKVVN